MSGLFGCCSSYYRDRKDDKQKQREPGTGAAAAAAAVAAANANASASAGTGADQKHRVNGSGQFGPNGGAPGGTGNGQANGRRSGELDANGNRRGIEMQPGVGANGAPLSGVNGTGTANGGGSLLSRQRGSTATDAAAAAGLATGRLGTRTRNSLMAVEPGDDDDNDDERDHKAALARAILHPAPALETGQRPPGFDRFFHWLGVHGAKFPKLDIREYAAGYRGIHVVPPETHSAIPSAITSAGARYPGTANAAAAAATAHERGPAPWARRKTSPNRRAKARAGAAADGKRRSSSRQQQGGAAAGAGAAGPAGAQRLSLKLQHTQQLGTAPLPIPSGNSGGASGSPTNQQLSTSPAAITASPPPPAGSASDKPKRRTGGGTNGSGRPGNSSLPLRKHAAANAHANASTNPTGAGAGADAEDSGDDTKAVPPAAGAAAAALPAASGSRPGALPPIHGVKDSASGAQPPAAAGATGAAAAGATQQPQPQPPSSPVSDDDTSHDDYSSGTDDDDEDDGPAALKPGVRSGEILLWVPLELVITVQLARTSRIGRRLIRAGANPTDHQLLASYLLQERFLRNGPAPAPAPQPGASSNGAGANGVHPPAPASPSASAHSSPAGPASAQATAAVGPIVSYSRWAPWLDVMPASYKNIMPIFFTPEEMSWLKGCPLIQQSIESQRKLFHTDYANLCNAYPEYAEFTLDEFIWARLVVITRVFGLVINGVKTTALVPLADMMNHMRPAGTAWTFDNESQGFTLTAYQMFSPGDAVCESYGKKDNVRFFVNYGFCVEDNDSNEATICISLLKDDPAYAAKLKVVGSDALEFKLSAHYDANVRLFLAFLRLVHAKPHQLRAVVGDPNAFYAFHTQQHNRPQNSGPGQGQGLGGPGSSATGPSQRPGAGSGPQSNPGSNPGTSGQPSSSGSRSSQSAINPTKVLQLFIEPLSFANEFAALVNLRWACQQRLKHFDTTLAADRRLLASPACTGNLRNCVIYRMGIKSILHYMITFATRALHLLLLPPKLVSYHKTRGTLHMLSAYSGISGAGAGPAGANGAPSRANAMQHLQQALQRLAEVSADADPSSPDATETATSLDADGRGSEDRFDLYVTHILTPLIERVNERKTATHFKFFEAASEILVRNWTPPQPRAPVMPQNVIIAQQLAQHQQLHAAQQQLQQQQPQSGAAAPAAAAANGQGNAHVNGAGSPTSLPRPSGAGAAQTTVTTTASGMGLTPNNGALASPLVPLPRSTSDLNTPGGATASALGGALSSHAHSAGPTSSGNGVASPSHALAGPAPSVGAGGPTASISQRAITNTALQVPGPSSGSVNGGFNGPNVSATAVPQHAPASSQVSVMPYPHGPGPAAGPTVSGNGQTVSLNQMERLNGPTGSQSANHSSLYPPHHGPAVSSNTTTANTTPATHSTLVPHTHVGLQQPHAQHPQHPQHQHVRSQSGNNNNGSSTPPTANTSQHHPPALPSLDLKALLPSPPQPIRGPLAAAATPQSPLASGEEDDDGPQQPAFAFGVGVSAPPRPAQKNSGSLIIEISTESSDVRQLDLCALVPLAPLSFGSLTQLPVPIAHPQAASANGTGSRRNGKAKEQWLVTIDLLAVAQAAVAIRRDEEAHQQQAQQQQHMSQQQQLLAQQLVQQQQVAALQQQHQIQQAAMAAARAAAAAPGARDSDSPPEGSQSGRSHRAEPMYHAHGHAHAHAGAPVLMPQPLPQPLPPMGMPMPGLQPLLTHQYGAPNMALLNGAGSPGPSATHLHPHPQAHAGHAPGQALGLVASTMSGSSPSATSTPLTTGSGAFVVSGSGAPGAATAPVQPASAPAGVSGSGLAVGPNGLATNGSGSAPYPSGRSLKALPPIHSGGMPALQQQTPTLSSRMR